MPTKPSLPGHDGIRQVVRERNPDGTPRVWSFIVADELGKETSQRHTSEKEGLKWATAKRREFLKGGSAGKASLHAVGTELVALLRGRGLDRDYVTSLEQLVKACVRAGIDDLKDPQFAVKFELWLNALKPLWYLAPGEEHKFASKSRTDLSKSTKAKLGRAMSRIVTYGMKKAHLGILRNPLDGFEAPRPEQRLKPTFQVPELQLLVGDKFRHDAWWLPMCHLIYTGMRAQEAMHLKWEYIDWTAGAIEVRIDPEYDLKYQKERVLPLQAELREVWAQVMVERGLTVETARGYIIENENLRQRGVCIRERLVTKDLDNSYTRAFNLAIDRAGVDIIKGRSLHSTRHTHITMQLAGGVDFYRLMEWVGHEDESTTLGYGRGRAKFVGAVEHWPVAVRRGVTLCLRHHHASAFHNPDEFTDEMPVVIVGMRA